MFMPVTDTSGLTAVTHFLFLTPTSAHIAENMQKPAVPNVTMYARTILYSTKSRKMLCWIKDSLKDFIEDDMYYVGLCLNEADKLEAYYGRTCLNCAVLRLHAAVYTLRIKIMQKILKFLLTF